jgi:hypothetical protein
MAFHFVDDIFPFAIHLVKVTDARPVTFEIPENFTEDEDLVHVFNIIIFEQELALGADKRPGPVIKRN